MKLSLSSFTLVCLALFMNSAPTAHADTYTYTFTVSGSGVFSSGSGNLTAVTNPSLPNVLDVTSITGNVGGLTITGLLPCPTYDPNTCQTSGSSFFYDNRLYPNGQPGGIQMLDAGGIAFALGDSGLEGAFAAYGTHTFAFLTNTIGQNTFPIGLVITQTPEPSSFLLLGTGLVGIAGAARRRIAELR